MTSNFMLGFLLGVGATIFVYCVAIAIQDKKIAHRKKQLDHVHDDPNYVVHPNMVVSDKTLERTLNTRNIIDPLMKSFPERSKSNVSA